MRGHESPPELTGTHESSAERNRVLARERQIIAVVFQ